MKRVVVLGAAGSGESTLARWIGEWTGLPVKHLDQLHWLPHWTPRPMRSGLRWCRRWSKRGAESLRVASQLPMPRGWRGRMW